MRSRPETSMVAETLAARIDGAAPAAPLRKAALLLHAMNEVDRRWMLARVEEPQRTRVVALLEELVALAFPADPELLRESLGRSAASTSPSAPLRSSEPQ